MFCQSEVYFLLLRSEHALGGANFFKLLQKGPNHEFHMVDDEMRSSIVRILTSDGKTAGTGFVVTNDGLIATCSHVVQVCQSQKCGNPRPEKVNIIFLITGEQREAWVEPDLWRSCEVEDVAILRVDGDLPSAVRPLILGSSEGTDTHAFDTFGFPEQSPKDGTWGEGHIRKGLKIQGVQVLQLSSPDVTLGFSGAPIVDRLRNRVVGMVTSITTPDSSSRGGETAFITPSETLLAIYPALKLSDVCPYRNLEAFTEADAAFFFGRQRVVETLVDNLQNEPRFLAVFGASGSGKSSIVQAGLIPQLRKGAMPGSDCWEIIVTRPMHSSFKQHLANLNTASAPIALVIDQFEELFVAYEETACAEVIAQLTGLLESPADVTLIIVMRNDFYSLFVQHEALAQWLKERVVNVWPTMKREEVESIVRDPASAVGWQFEDGLVELIVNDTLETPAKGHKKAGSSTLLPLLEFALTQLWERRQDGMLTRDSYRRIGSVIGGLTRWANEAYNTFDEGLHPLVRRIFTDLVHLGNEEEHIAESRRRRELPSLVRREAERADIQHVVRRLVDVRLLVASQDTESQQETVEIIHDALLWEWERLRQWIEEDRQFLLWHQELEQRVRAWVGTNSGNSAERDPYKLFGGSDLMRAIEWVRTRAQDLSQDERDFIEASKARQEQEAWQHKRYTRRMVLGYSLAGGLGLVAAFGVGRYFLISEKGSPPTRVSLPYSYKGHTSAVYSVAWSPDGKHLASAGVDATVQVWDAGTGNRLLTYRGHTNAVYSVAWSPDGKRLASGGFDNTVQEWDASTGNQALTYRGHTDSVWSVAWSPDGKRLASAGRDKTVQVIPML